MFLLLRNIRLIEYLKDKTYSTEGDLEFFRSNIHNALIGMYQSSYAFNFIEENIWKDIAKALDISEPLPYEKPDDLSSFNPNDVMNLLLPPKYKKNSKRMVSYEGIVHYLLRKYKRFHLREELALIHYSWLMISAIQLKKEPSEKNCSKLTEICRYTQKWIWQWSIQDKYIERKIDVCKKLVLETRLNHFTIKLNQ